MENEKNLVQLVLFVKPSSFTDEKGIVHEYDRLFVVGLIDGEEVEISLKCASATDKRDLKRIINRARGI